MTSYLRSALDILRWAAGEVNRIGPDNTLADALQLIADTAACLVAPTPGDRPTAVVYIYDAELGRFDPASRVSAGEPPGPPPDDRPRSDGLGANALRLRRRILSYEDTHIPMHDTKRAAGVRTLACYPLLVSGQPVGALYISLQVERRFGDDELLVLDTFVHQAAVAIHNTRRFEGINRALQRKVNELERLRRAERLISSRLSLDDTLNEILATALALTRAEHGSFRLLDKRGGVLKLGAIAGAKDRETQPERALRLNERDSVMGWVAVNRRPARIGDLSQPPWNDIYRPLYPGRQMRSELAVPLLGAGGGLEGVLNLESPLAYAFSEDDQRLLETLAVQAVIAIQEAKLLEAIEDVSSRLLSQPLPELLAFTVERACDLINAPFGALWTLSPDDPQTLVVRAATAGHSLGETLPLGGTLIGQAVQLRQPLSSPDVRDDPRFLRPDLARQMGWVSALIVPLLARDRAARGALAVYSSEPRVFSAWDMRLLTSLAQHIAAAAQQAEYLKQIQSAHERQAVAETFAAFGDVAANLLHRVNNLVGVIPAQVQGLADKRPQLLADAYVSKTLDDIEGRARAAMQAARETMAFLRPLRLRPTSVSVSYRTALERLHVPPHVRVASVGLSELPPVLAGEEQLRQVFVNLIENALESIGDSPGRVTVSGREVCDTFDPARPWVEIVVADDGPGVPPEERERIFASEYSTKRTPNKLGFGLWWVKTFVQRFGGTIALAEDGARNKAGENGCAFVICLPVSDEGDLE